MILLSLLALSPLTHALTDIPLATGPFLVASNNETIQTNRTEIYAPPDQPQHRRFLISTFVPIDPNVTCSEPVRKPYMTPLVIQAFGHYLAQYGLPDDALNDIYLQLVNPKLPAPGSDPRTFPLVVFSHGFSASRHIYGAVATWLASRGYAVVLIDHTYDAAVVQFEDGTIIPGFGTPLNDTAATAELIQVRVDDVISTIDYLQTYNNPLTQWIDFTQIIAAGHSLGGDTSLVAAIQNDFILGAVNLDGLIHGAGLAGLTQPALLVGTPGHFDQDASWPEFWDNQRGPGMVLEVNGTVHDAFSDLPLLPNMLDLDEETLENLQGYIGTVDGLRLEQILSGILVPFFELALSGDAEGLRDVEDAFEEVSIVRSNLDA